MKKRNFYLFILAIFGLLILSGCSTYVAEYKVDENHYIRIPSDKDERWDYCFGFCSKYTHDPCLDQCLSGEIRKSVVDSYKETYGLLTTEEKINLCISRYKDREGDLAIYTNVTTRCTICQGGLECPELEES